MLHLTEQIGLKYTHIILREQQERIPNYTLWKKKVILPLSVILHIKTIHGFNNNTITLNLEATER